MTNEKNWGLRGVLFNGQTLGAEGIRNIPEKDVSSIKSIAIKVSAIRAETLEKGGLLIRG